MTLKQYTNDVYKRKATERLLRELIEAAIDINTHIIVQTHNAIVAGLRNVLVHEYDTLNHSIVFGEVRTASNIYPQYINSVENYISSQD